MYRYHTTCRACGNLNPRLEYIKDRQNESPLIPVLDLGLQPLANDFQSIQGDMAGYAPLKVMFCERCRLGQLSVVVDPKLLYSQYAYATSPSQTMQNHFSAIWDDLKDISGTAPKRVLEIGSNNGALLEFLKAKGATDVIGVDPAANMATEAAQRGIKAIVEFWNPTTAQIIGHVDTIIARHVFAHVHNWREFIRGLDLISDEQTTVLIEVPWEYDLLDHQAFDTIYHEHLSYVSLTALCRALEGSSLRIGTVRRYDIHGGVLGIFLHRTFVDPRFHDLIEMEQTVTAEAWKILHERSQSLVKQLTSTVKNARLSGKRVFGFGASAKSTVWVNACQFTKADLEYITDTTPQKLYKLSPGSNIPIVDEGALLRELPDYAVMFAWNYEAEILAKNKMYTDKGGKFIVPLPKLRIVP